jgi:phage terminase large subunit-like protein
LRASGVKTRATDPVAPYVAGVLAGTVLAAPLVRLACERHRRDREEGAARGLIWRPDLAQRPIKFIETVLRLPDSGAPFRLFAWQKFVIGSLFGWRMPDGTRRFRSAYVEAAKGSAKTPTAAALMVYMILEDGERAAECYSAAPSRDQSLICFKDAARMVQASPALSKQIQVLEQALYHPASGSVIRPLSSEARTLDGRRVHCAALDELHEHDGPDVVNKMRASTKGRRQPLLLEITNSGWNRHSVCWEHHELSREILEGTRVNDEWFAFVCGLDAGDDWQDPAVWPKANPSLPTLPGVRYLREQVEEAKAMPSRQSMVRRLNFCEWVEAATTWLDMAKVRACAVPALDLRAVAGQPCVIGIDIGTTESLTVVALAFRGPDGITTVAVHGFLGSDFLLDRAQRDRLPYPAWVEAGHLETTPGPIVQLERVRAYIRDVATWATVHAVAYDDWGAVSLAQSLEADGFTVVKIDQSPKGLTAACRELERLVAEGQLRYASPLLDAHCANAMVRVTDAGMMPQKASDTQRIDALSATLTALAHALMAPPPVDNTSRLDREGEELLIV